MNLFERKLQDYIDGNKGVQISDLLEAGKKVTTKISPFTGGEVTLETKESTVTFRGTPITAERKYYKCVDTGREFSDSDLDDDFMWAVFRKYSNGRGFDWLFKEEKDET